MNTLQIFNQNLREIFDKDTLSVHDLEVQEGELNYHVSRKTEDKVELISFVIRDGKILIYDAKKY